MKDLITTIGAIMILMVFVMQFCSNQVLATRILVADYIIDDYESINVEEIKVGDNDTLSSLLVPMINADLLVLASDIDFNNYGAVEVVSGFENFHILQYKNKKLIKYHMAQKSN